MTPLLISVAGEPVSLWPDRALGWRDALFVADVHIGKSAVFRKAGLPMPPGELEHDLSRLSALVACSGARRLVVLGDFVHGMVGDGVTQAVSEWRKNLTTTWFVVRGNHDRHVPVWPNEWRVEEYPSGHREGPFCFHHEPTSVRGAVVLAGHVHPTVTVGRASDRLRFPAFVVQKDCVLLPAFTQFSGGPGFSRSANDRRFACTAEAVVALDD